MAYAMNNFNDMIAGLSGMRRRAQLTGQPITGQDIMNIQEPYFAAYREYAPQQAANALYEDRLAEEKRQRTLEMQQQGDIASGNRTMGYVSSGLGAAGTALAGYNLFRTPTVPTPAGTAPVTPEVAAESPGLLSRAATGIRDFASSGLDTLQSGISRAGDAFSNLLGTPEAGVGVAATGTEGLGGLAPLMESGVGDPIASELSAAGTTAATDGAGGILGAIATPLSIAAPYYALAKAGGAVINSITDNNPWMKETPFGRLGGSLDEPLAVEQYWGDEFARNGIGDMRTNRMVSDTLNPIGGALLNAQGGDWEGMAKNLLSVGIPGLSFIQGAVDKLFGRDDSDAKENAKKYFVYKWLKAHPDWQRAWKEKDWEYLGVKQPTANKWAWLR